MRDLSRTSGGGWKQNLSGERQEWNSLKEIGGLYEVKRLFPTHPNYCQLYPDESSCTAYLQGGCLTPSVQTQILNTALNLRIRLVKEQYHPLATIATVTGG